MWAVKCAVYILLLLLSALPCDSSLSGGCLHFLVSLIVQKTFYYLVEKNRRKSIFSW